MLRPDPIVFAIVFAMRHMFPLRAAYFRQVLHHVMGFPHLRLLCLIRLPFNQGSSTSASVPLPDFATNVGLRIVLFPGFPFVPHYRHPIFLAQELNGPPKFLFTSVHTCHGLRTPPVLHILTIERMILYCLRRALQPSATGTGSFRSDTSTSGSTVSLEPARPLAGPA